MAAQKLYALHDHNARRLYIGGRENAQAHAPDAEVVLEVEVADAAVALEYVRDGLAFWHQGDGWFQDGVSREVIAAVFTTVGTFPPSFLARWVDQVREAERKADAPPAALLKEAEVEEAPELDASTARAERRRRALEAGFVRPE
jgi:hypothetical protein